MQNIEVTIYTLFKNLNHLLLMSDNFKMCYTTLEPKATLESTCEMQTDYNMDTINDVFQRSLNSDLHGSRIKREKIEQIITVLTDQVYQQYNTKSSIFSVQRCDD